MFMSKRVTKLFIACLVMTGCAGISNGPKGPQTNTFAQPELPIAGLVQKEDLDSLKDAQDRLSRQTEQAQHNIKQDTKQAVQNGLIPINGELNAIKSEFQGKFATIEDGITGLKGDIAARLTGMENNINAQATAIAAFTTSMTMAVQSHVEASLASFKKEIMTTMTAGRDNNYTNVPPVLIIGGVVVLLAMIGLIGGIIYLIVSQGKLKGEIKMMKALAMPTPISTYTDSTSKKE